MQHDRQRYDEPVDGSPLHLPPSDGNSNRTIDPDLSTHEISDTFRYVRKGVISEGATGVVWLVFDNLLQRDFAAKVLKTDFTDSDSLNILAEEVRAATRVNHPNVVRVYDMIFMGVWCIAMQYISGTPFASRTHVWKTWSLFDLLGIAIQITDAVAAAHRAGVVHGDLSPTNVIIDDDGKPYIIDFGRTYGLLRTRAIVPMYAAPEGNVATVSTASDVYSLGILLHELVTGQLPFPVDLAGDTLDSVHPRPSARPAVSRTLPRGLRNVLKKALEQEPEKRYASAVELHEALVSVRRTALLSQRLRPNLVTAQPQSTLGPKRAYWPLLGATSMLCLGLILPRPLIPSHTVRNWLTFRAERHFDVAPLQLRKCPPELRYLAGAISADLALDLAYAQGQRIIRADVGRCLSGETYHRGAHTSASTTIVDGSLACSHDEVTVTLSLRNERGQTVWTTVVSSPRTDIRTLQRQLWTALASELKFTAAPTKVHGPMVPAAYNTILRARDKLLQSTSLEAVRSAQSLFESANALEQSEDALLGLVDAGLLEYKLTGDRQHLEQAQNAIAQAVAAGTQSCETSYALFRVLRAAGETSRAMDALTQALACAPDSEALHLARGRYLADQGLRRAARNEYERALVCNRQDALSYTALGALDLDSGRYDSAIVALQHALTLNPQSPVALSNLGAAYMRAGQVESAKPYLESAVQRLPSAASFFNLGLAHYYSGAFQLAITLFEKAVATDTTFDIAWGALGRAYAVVGDHKSGKTAYSNALKSAQAHLKDVAGKPDTYAHLVMYDLGVEDHRAATLHLQRATALDPLNPQVLIATALFEGCQGHPRRASAALSRLMDRGYPRALLRADPILRPFVP